MKKTNKQRAAIKDNESKGVLSPDTLYIGDNGRCFCGKLRCSGASAFYAGCDLSGCGVLPIGPAEIAYAKQEGIPLRCEGCGKEAK